MLLPSDTSIAELIKEKTDDDEFRERIHVEQGQRYLCGFLNLTSDCDADYLNVSKRVVRIERSIYCGLGLILTIVWERKGSGGGGGGGRG